MGLQRDRNRLFVKGLGLCEVRELSPTPGASFLDIGYLDESELNNRSEREVIKDENGIVVNVLEREVMAEFNTNMQQTSIDEVAFIQNAASKLHAVRYSGMAGANTFQYYCIEQAVIDGNVPLKFAKGKRLLPMHAVAIDISDEKGFTVPLFYQYEAAKKIYMPGLQLWMSPRRGYNAATNRVLDISGFARHGTLNSDYATIWQAATTPNRFLRFDGVNDQLDFGNILNDDGVGDFLIELWVRTQAADGTKEEIISKKSLIDDNSAGFAIYRTLTSNLLTFRLSSGTASATVSNGTPILQNVWKHFAVTVDRDGNATPYLNGAPDGSAASIAAIGNGSNVLNLYLGRDGMNFGQVDKGGCRFYRFGAGGLPSDIATIVANHYNAEKSFYGL